MICSVVYKCVLHILVSLHARVKIYWAKETGFDDAIFAMTSFCAKL